MKKVNTQIISGFILEIIKRGKKQNDSSKTDTL